MARRNFRNSSFKSVSSFYVKPIPFRRTRSHLWESPITLPNSSFFYDTPILGTTLQNCDDVMQISLQPKLLPGEIEVARAKNVYLYPSITNKDEKIAGTLGLLVVTNFKLSFIAVEDSQSANFIYQENYFLGKNDVTLTNIDLIYQIVDNKKKLVSPNHKTRSKIDYLFIICKNFRTLKFGFSGAEIGKGKHIADALVKFAFPNRHTLLFSYNYKENYYNPACNASMFNMFNKKSDWTQEMLRCGASTKDWRVLAIDREPELPIRSLPMSYVVPKMLTDHDYMKAAESFRDSRNVIWVYSLDNASLIRMAELLPDKTDNKYENLMIEHVRACHPQKRQPHLMELTKYLPTIQDIYTSYVKLRQLCTPDSPKLFTEQDEKFLKLLDASCWLLYVSLCLQYSNEAAKRIRQGESVILQENDGRDMCCIISSLTQILLDPHFRTMKGFQSLIQKEWVALGHPFSDRLGHVINSTTSEQSPLFLLFLDCTWQLLQQFPEEFEFSETFLTTIWDAAFLPIFDTFQFNSEHDRYSARNDGLILRPVWDWGEQFADKDIMFFSNPFYRRPPEQSRKSLAVLPPSAVPLPIIGAQDYHRPGSRMSLKPPQLTALSLQDNRTFLEPRYKIRDLDIWCQCYYRWIPIVEIQNGGFPQVDIFNRLLLSNICKLQQALQTGDFDDIPLRNASSPNQQTNGSDSITITMQQQIMPSVNSFFPFSRNNSDPNELTDILNTSNELLADGSIFDALSQAHID